MAKKKPVWRPKSEFCWEDVDSYLLAGCSGIEIAHTYGMNEETLYTKCKKEKGCGFKEYSYSKRSTGEAILRRQQFEEALGVSERKGNVQLLLRLGEERLKQGKSANAESQLHDILEQNKAGGSSEPFVEASEPLPHQEQPGTEDSIQTELGSIRADWNPSQI